MNNSEMPPIKDLFKESWEAFKASLGNIFILTLLGSAIGFVVGILVVLGIAGMGFMSVISGALEGKEATISGAEAFFTPSRIIQFGLATLVLMLVAGIVSTAVRLAIVFTIGKYKEKPKMGMALKKGFTLIIPSMVVGLVTTLAVFGGTFLLVVPGIIMGFFFMFVTYELILGDKKWFAAITGSVQVMSQHFGEILLRIFVFMGGMLLVFQLPMYLLELIVKSLSGNAPAEAISLSFILSSIRIVLGTGLGIFGLVYSVITYKQAKDATNENIKPNMGWMWVVSFVGWMIAILLGMQLGKLANNPLVQKQAAAVMEQSNVTTETKLSEQEKIANWKTAISPEARVYYDKSQDLFVQMKAASAKQAVVKKLNDENIVALKKAVELDANNPELWATLSDAYTWINSKATMEDALLMSEKAEKLDPSVWGYTTRTAEILLMLKRYDESILKFQQVIRAEDNYARAHIGLGLAYKATGISDEAKIELQKGIDILSKYNADGSYDADILQARKALGTL